ncbi:MAG: hypothetical protein OXE99_15125 [Cellvibrionales bacterium]|nr:hypothetical protein [Cellvibrionales bacterium]
MSPTIDLTQAKKKQGVSYFHAIILPVTVCLLYSWTFLPFLCDDSLISLRYVQNLLEGNGLTWSEGQPVEGYSNLGWILLIAVPGFFGADLVIATRIISSLLMVSVLVTNYYYWRPFVTTDNARFFIIAQYAFALCATTGVWMVGGLEQPLLAAMMALSLLFITKALRENQPRFWLVASLCLGIMCITRPDIPLLCLAIAIGIFLSRGFNAKQVYHCSLLAIFPVLFVIGQLAFRLYYYGEWVPNTAYIKAQPNLITLGIGALYVTAGLFFMLPFSFYALSAINISLKSSHRDLGLIAASSTLISLTYLLIIGGDIFPAFRHFTTTVVLFTFILPAFSLQIEQSQTTFSNTKIAFFAVIYIAMQWLNPATGFSRGEGWVREGKPMADMLKTGWKHKQPVIAVDAAGSLPYYTGYPAIDMLGLNDHHIARQAPDPTSVYIGHQFGDGEYVYSRQPDMVNFCFPQGKEKPCWSGGKALYKLPEFQKNYTPVAFAYREGNTAIQWIRTHSPIIGIEKNKDSWLIPSYLLKGDEITQTYLNDANNFAVDIHKAKQIALSSTRKIASIELIPHRDATNVDLIKTAHGYQIILTSSDSPQSIEAIRVHFKAVDDASPL